MEGGTVTPMTASSALNPSALSAPGAAPTASTGAGAGRMMPMMPMHGMNQGQGAQGKSTKRDPVIYPESALHEPPKGVEQIFGANPEIESEEPPFGTEKTESTNN